MTKLETIVQNWNKESLEYYSTVYNTLIENDITTAQTLLEMDNAKLYCMTKITKQVMNAFKKQVIFSTMRLEEKQQEKGAKRLKMKNDYVLHTGIKSLDNSLDGGIHVNQIVEICGVTSSKFANHLLTTFISTYDDDVYIFDTTGMFEPRSMKLTTKSIERITCTQLNDLNDFYVSMDNLTTLFSLKDKNATPSFILIHDISILIHDWTKIDKLIETLNLLSRLNCIIIILNTKIIDFTSNEFELYWNPMIDIRLHVNKENQVKIVKSRHQKTITN